MREVSNGVAAKPAASVPGWLNECLIDGDPAAIRSARRARRKAVSVSLAVQVGLLATALIVPLFARVVVPRPERFTPIPPYARGGGATEPQRPQRQHQAQSQPSKRHSLFENIVQPAKIPRDIGRSGDSSTQSQAPPEVGPGDGSNRKGIAGGTETPEWARRPIIDVEPPEHAPRRSS